MTEKGARGDKVVFLAFSSETAVPEAAPSVLACAECRNKTFLAVCPRGSGFPVLRCAGCWTSLGKFGWAPDDDEGSAA